MLHLHGRHLHMMLASRSHVRGCWPCGRSARASVVADMIVCGVVDNCRVVGVVNDRDVYVGHSAVVVVRAPLPVTTEKPDPGVAETVVNASIVADLNEAARAADASREVNGAVCG